MRPGWKRPGRFLCAQRPRRERVHLRAARSRCACVAGRYATSRAALVERYATCVFSSVAGGGASVSSGTRLSLRETAFSFTLTLTIRDTPGSPIVTP